MIDSFLAFFSISSELVIALGAMLILLLGLIKKDYGQLIIYLGILFLFLGLYIITLNFGHDKSVFFNGLISANDYVSLMQIVIIIGTILALLISASYGNINKLFISAEFTALILFSVVGMLIMLSANDFILLYLGLELQSLCLYILATFDRDNILSSEAGLKYFVLGALASGILLYGISLIYGFSGTINLTEFSTLYQNAVENSVSIGVLIGMMMVVVALSFKIAAAPFHMWAPDVYQGSPFPVTAFFAIVPKIAAVALLAKLLLVHFDIWLDSWLQIITFLSVASMIIGSFGAIKQNNLKRLLAYSAIGHVGYMLIGLATQNEFGLESLTIYMIVYGLLSAGIFALITMIQIKGKENYELAALTGLSKTHPIIAFSITTIMLSMAGIPPFAGFIVKFYIFTAAVKSGLYFLTVIGLLTSVVSAYYYLKVIRIMYFEDDSRIKTSKNYHFGVILVAIGVVVFNILFFVIPSKFNAIVFSSIVSLVGNI
jgi:NADH-quinone oxidoreductase subunit N